MNKQIENTTQLGNETLIYKNFEDNGFFVLPVLGQWFCRTILRKH